MSQRHHLAIHKEILTQRSHIVRLIREFFWSRDFLEVDAPLLVRLPGQEPYLSPMSLTFHNERGQAFPGYLHTSPEYTMKKMLAASFNKIFFLGKTFRDYESFGGTHNPEFTLLEWYRAGTDMWGMMEDVEGLFRYVAENVVKNFQFSIINFQFPFERLHMREAWKKYAGVNLDAYLARDEMFALCIQKGYAPKQEEPFDDLFFRIFLNEIEPQLGKKRPTILHHYPISMAALAQASSDDPRYAERFELYAGGLELANAFTELTDADEQLRRLMEEQTHRRALGKDVYDIDDEFIAALRHMPPAGGIALGVDRLVQVLLGCKNIDDVIALPASQLF